MRDQELKLLELGERLHLQAILDSQRAEERLALLLADQIQEKEARLMRAISKQAPILPKGQSETGKKTKQAGKRERT